MHRRSIISLLLIPALVVLSFRNEPLAHASAPVGVILADVSVLKKNRTRTYGDDDLLQVDGNSSKRTFIRAQVTGLGDQPALVATLRLQVADRRGAGSKSGGRIHLIQDCNWDELTMNWKNRPLIDNGPLDTKGAVARGQVVEFDVAEAIVGDGVYCFALDSLSSDRVQYHSREAEVGAPELVITPVDPSGRVAVVEADASVRETQPDVNFGTSSMLWVDEKPVKRTFFRVRVRGFDAEPVRDARLRLQVVGSDEERYSARGSSGRLYETRDCAWNELTVTYDTQPTIDGPLLDKLGKVERGNVIEFDITPAITGDGIYCFALESSSRDGVIYGSREATVGGPVVVTTPEASVTSRLTNSVVQRQGGTYGPGSPAISGDGRFVAFVSGSPDLDPMYPNTLSDIFVHDRLAGTTQQVSVDSFGTGGNENSKHPVISADGRFVAFQSYASNLVADDTNGFPDVFVHDRRQKTTERVSVDSFGVGGNKPSGRHPHAMSADGRFVAFESYASNLVADDTNGWSDIFVHDRHERTTERVSAGLEDYQHNWRGVAISADGRIVAFTAHPVDGFCATCRPPTRSLEFIRNLELFVHDRQQQTTELVSVYADGIPFTSEELPQGLNIGWSPALSADGQIVVVGTPLDVIFVHDQRTGLTRTISIPTRWESDEVSRPINGGGGHWEAIDRQNAISADGRFLVASTGRSIHVHDLLTGTTQKLADGEAPSISYDGRLVAFASQARYLVTGPASAFGDIFVRAR